MQEPKFSVNALAGIALIFVGLILLFSVVLQETADRSVVNQFVPVEGTNLSVRYNSYLPNGLYEGDINTGKLVLAGDFGMDWGAAAAGDALYLNEYRRSDLGLLYCDLVRVDLRDYTKTVALRDVTLRGKCASGELVCTEGLASAALPENNPLCRLYALSRTDFAPAETSVVYLDPETGAELARIRDDLAVSEDHLAERYLNRTLKEAAV